MAEDADKPDPHHSVDESLLESAYGASSLADWIKSRLPMDFHFTPGASTADASDPDKDQKAPETVHFVAFTSDMAYRIEVKETKV